MPEKDGYSGHWADYDYSALYFSDVIEAEYSYKRATLAVENPRAGSPMSIVLVEGSFNDGSQAMLNEYVGDDPHTDGRRVLEERVLRIDDMDEDTAAGSYSVRFLRPELERRSHKLEIYTFDGTDRTLCVHPQQRQLYGVRLQFRYGRVRRGRGRAAHRCGCGSASASSPPQPSARSQSSAARRRK